MVVSRYSYSTAPTFTTLKLFPALHKTFDKDDKIVAINISVSQLTYVHAFAQTSVSKLRTETCP
jgi:hypothetical protein